MIDYFDKTFAEYEAGFASKGKKNNTIYRPSPLLQFVSSIRSSKSHPDLLVTQHQHHQLFQITPVLNTGLSLSEPLQLYKGYSAI